MEHSGAEVVSDLLQLTLTLTLALALTRPELNPIPDRLRSTRAHAGAGGRGVAWGGLSGDAVRQAAAAALLTQP